MKKSDCWKVYSLVTDIYTPNPRRLRDWITYPKTTGYESLHTTVNRAGREMGGSTDSDQRMDDIAEKKYCCTLAI